MSVPPAEPLASLVYDFGTVELTLSSRQRWLWRCQNIYAFQSWSALDYATRQEAFDAAARTIRGACNIP